MSAEKNNKDADISTLMPPNVYKDPDDGQANTFLLELEFVQCLANPTNIHVSAKVYMVLMEEDSVSLYKDKQPASLRNHEDTLLYKERIVNGHDMFLESVLETGSYTKLYSYTHLINGFALHVTSEEVLKVLENAKGVRIFHEDIKMEKLTTHTPKYLGIPSDVWPTLGGAESAGEQVVIGMIDTGIDPNHPSFSTSSSVQTDRIRRRSASKKFRGICQTGKGFTKAACNDKIVGARYFSHGAIVAGDFNATRDYSSPFDADGHGSHTASTAAGNSGVPVIVNGFNYGFASGMAPGAQIAVYKALYTFGGYMSDVVAAVDQAVEDGVDILSLSIGPSSAPSYGPSVFLDVLEIVLLFATKAGVLVVQAVGNGGPLYGTSLSFNPWITSVAASMTDRKYNSSLKLGNGVNFSGTGLAPPTIGKHYFPIAAAKDVCNTNTSSVVLEYCQHPETFIPSLVQGKLIICNYTLDFEGEAASITAVAETMQKVGAAGFIMTLGPGIDSDEVRGTTVTFQIPGIVLNNIQASNALWEYYNSNTVRNRNGRAVSFTATARILDGRQATYTGNGPIVASYSSRGPDVDTALMQTVDVLKPNILAPGSSIWAAWSPNSEEDTSFKGQNFALVSGTSMATPHIAGVAALIKQKHPQWSPAAITSAMMTTADTADHLGVQILSQQLYQLANATPFDYGSGFVHPSQALNPGLVFDISFQNYVQFLCGVPGVDEKSIRRAVGVGCLANRKTLCSDLNTASVTVSNLVGSRTVLRTVRNVATEMERYTVIVKEPTGVSVRVTPNTFSIRPNISRSLQITLKAPEATKGFMFGELLLRGDRKHNVRIPLTVFATSALTI